MTTADDRVKERFAELQQKWSSKPPGFGRPNPHCSNCADERGGPFGHETSECRYRAGMTAGEVAGLLPEHRRSAFWGEAIDRYFAAELAKLDAAGVHTTTEGARTDGR